MPLQMCTFVEEMKVFVWINMLMGIHCLPSYLDNWSSDPAVRVFYVANTMARNRYEQLCRYLHCLNPGTANSWWQPSQSQTVMMCVHQPWKNLSRWGNEGRLLRKQYMTKRPIRWGIKIWCPCDSLTGYCLAIHVCTSKERCEAGYFGLGYRIVIWWETSSTNITICMWTISFLLFN